MKASLTVGMAMCAMMLSLLGLACGPAQSESALPVASDTSELSEANLATSQASLAAKCSSDAQCNDNNPCTFDKCLNRQCSNAAKADGSACDDGNSCTTGDVCQSGKCQASPVVCAPNQCQTSLGCNRGTGKCAYVAKTNLACDDKNTCTTNDRCTKDPAGVCKGGTPRPDGTACDDGNANTVGDFCRTGICTGVDRCIGRICSAIDQCHLAGACIDHATGACSNPVAPDGRSCSDGDATTAGDVCTNGVCKGVDHCVGVVCTPLDQCHLAGTCIDHTTGACSQPLAPNGRSCNDGNACSVGDACRNGRCETGAPMICSNHGECQMPSTCNPSTGTCSNLPAPDGTSCTGTDSCGQPNRCRAGLCGSAGGTCDRANVMFVTSTTYAGDLGGLAGADAKCAAHAAAAGLPGNFVALLGTSTNEPLARLMGSRGWNRRDGKPFADTLADLGAGRIFYPPMLDEFGQAVPAGAGVFTGADGGTVCNDWQAADFSFIGVAQAGRGNKGWLSARAGAFCASGNMRLYCFETGHTASVRPVAGPGRKAFLSRGTFVPGGGLPAADAVCGSEAGAAGLAGAFKALVATPTAGALSRFDLTGATWYRPDGVQVVARASDLLAAPLLAPIDLDATGAVVVSSASVWTGGTSPGEPSLETCDGWTTNATSKVARLGDAEYVGAAWFSDFSDRCDGGGLSEAGHLYCLEETSIGAPLLPPFDPTPNLMFVTSAASSGDLGGLAGADARCQQSAAAAGLPGTFTALLSTSGTSALSRLGNARGWVRLDGRPVVNSIGDLFAGYLFYPPMLDEFGRTIVELNGVGTTQGDKPQRTCNDWTSSLPTAFFEGGWSSSGGVGVYDGAATSCDYPLHVYCLETAHRSSVQPAALASKRLAFLSSGSFSPAGGLASADDICAREAADASLSGAFKALLATTTESAISRFDLSGPPWVRPDGVRLAGDARAFASGSLVAPIAVRADGVHGVGSGRFTSGEVFIGADRLDLPGTDTCSNWTSTDAASESVGRRIDSAFLPTGGTGWGTQTLRCDATGAKVFCLQQ